MADNCVLREDSSELKIGDRIFSEGNYGTVHYIGTVPPTSGLWLGVEWDEPTRGKHNGSRDGVSYFKTRHPTSGSFVRPTKICSGITIVKALHERYGLKEQGDAGIDTDEMFVIDKNLKQTVVEVVGAKKVNKLQSEFSKLRKVSFFAMNVYGPGQQKEFGHLCPHVTDLDLAGNLLSSWQSVADITTQLPHLKYLNMSENQLIIPKDTHSLAPSFVKVKSITLNKMKLSWEDILTICSMFPALEEIHACFNEISHLSPPTDDLKGLRVLDLLTNEIEDWNEVLKLGSLSHLDTLLISENKINNVFFPDCQAPNKTDLFSKLRVVVMKENAISEWTSINELNKLQNLEELQLAGNPIMTSYNLETVRQLLVAKLSNIKLISRTPISYEERKGAEIDYLKRFGSEWKKSGGNADPKKNQPSQEFRDCHPCFQRIIEKWGAPEDSELEVKSTALKDNLLAINIYSPDHQSKGVLSKKLPTTMSIQKLKTLIQRLFKVNSEPKLTYKSHKKSEGPEIELDNDMRQLGFFSIESGDTVTVKW